MPADACTTVSGVRFGTLAQRVRALLGRRPYSIPQPWTHAPILWAATDEVVPGGHPAGVNVGGGVSGRW